ncbi:MAG: alkyl hydroperoxide reductase [Coriobacteriia bacterium]|nr:alkyl hydroperoxide reductase [Coriobacteriia bacterium]
MLPRVRELHERFPGILTVIGVHAGKFRAERATPLIETARRRLGVEHPVVNDRRFRIWRAYGVTAWPTVAVVGPDGRLLGRIAGEFDVGALAEEISGAADAYRADGLLRPGPEPFETVPSPAEEGALRFPSRALVSGGRLFVSDAGHRRVLEAEARRGPGRLAARVVRVWGDGRRGFADGAAGEARFAEPQGLAATDGAVFVADRANHAIRRLDLASGEVRTVAGTGALAAGRLEEGDARTPLRSPWGLLAEDGTLLCSMAGSHQLCRLRPHAGAWSLSVEAGTGAEDIRDGPARLAALAQPTGLAAGTGGEVHVADCESSSVRALGGGGVRTLVGTGLFDFGDRDGPAGEALLQHAEDVAFHRGAVVAADTYNDKLKRIDPASGETRSLPGEVAGGLSGPRGVASLGETLLVTDTDAHRLVEVAPDGSLAGVPIEL